MTTDEYNAEMRTFVSVPYGMTILIFLGSFDRSNKVRASPMASMVTTSGKWDWDRLTHLLPTDVVRKIAAHVLPSRWLGDDFPGWKWNSNRKFTTKSIYVALVKDEG
ncbi:hypothetical protein V6N13_088797 [Hibiscus sabdariffa]